MLSKVGLTLLILTVASIQTAECSSQVLRVQFAYPTLGNGDSMYVRGSGCGLNWEDGKKMDGSACNLYTLDLDMSDCSGKILEVKALVNDQTWQIGANVAINIGAVPQDGEEGSIYTATAYPFFYSTEGKTTLFKDVYSSQLKNKRSVIVYTPPSYFENDLKPVKNVIIAHDGQNLFNDSTSFIGIAWHCDKTVDLLVNEGNMEEVAIVGVYNTPDRDNEYTFDVDPTQHNTPKGDKYLDFLEKEVFQLAESSFRFPMFRDNLCILGSSLGGLINSYAGWTRSSVYSKSVCMSSSFWWNNESFVHDIMVNDPKPKYPITFYLDSGDQGDGQDDKYETLRVRSKMESMSWQLNKDLFYYLDKGGEHNEYYWGRRFHVPMADLYPPQVVEPIPF